MSAQRRLTAEDHARAAAMDAPTPKTIARVFGEYLSQDAVKHHEFTYGPWLVRIYDSPYCAGQLLVCADPAVPSEPPAPSRSEEVENLAAARAWIKGLGA